jgi:hypothetical protein
MDIKIMILLYVSATDINKKERYIFPCRDRKEVNLVRKRASYNGLKYIYTHKSLKHQWNTDLKYIQITPLAMPQYYTDFCECCGRDFKTGSCLGLYNSGSGMNINDE